ncbi:hypothetical protein Malapachy_2744 [Malassezia pachydermatis]|uniref:Proteasome assembly chaperone 1 n=1 Tax=Malassezia pachydermatis TaxID=77020 RepID=A0A0M8MWM0_9BASI|nr:hypothetical protein Malapachy_2744 [Malassezia pachydermatis]KOS15794.1 hypothetical protein Malapachy_2744 [Malassezia pachydermatis]
MDLDLFYGSGPPPRYELESDDEDSAPSTPSWKPAVEGTPVKHRPMLVFLGDMGATCLAAWLPTNHLLVTERIKGPQGVWAVIHTPTDSMSPILVYIAQPDTVPLAAQASLTQALLQQWLPSSITLFQAYAPTLYMHGSNPPSKPNSAEAPVRWLASSTTSVPTASWLQRWEAPNTLTGCAAALMMQAVYLSTPAVIYCLPTARAVPHPTFQPALIPAAAPHAVSSSSPEEAYQRVSHLVNDMDVRTARMSASIFPSSVSQDPSSPVSAPTLWHTAWQALTHTRTPSGAIGDGGIQI